MQQDDSRALAEAAAAILGDPATTLRMGLAARARAVARFSFQRMVDEYEGLYYRLTSGQRR